MASVRRDGPGSISCFSEGQILPYYTKGTSRTKVRPSRVKIMVFRPLIWAVECLYGRRSEIEKHSRITVNYLKRLTNAALGQL